ncbi:Hsp20/alpha crystallin family protein [Bowmanella pacifica]|uniref:Molecular chaperone Hsp20 n=1 Tax=Bowmanella pacifica TaxID=502051 RepID=A0A917YUG0_9ALTE|nr:Hsp20/alpha crystallin family protein [Bowmanella pacifica]GGO65865.1 molecular chaperone Hsp20 [Bowmanella pacifica]
MSFFPSLFGHQKPEAVTSLRSRLDNVFDDFFKDWPQAADAKWLRPAVDVAETKEALEVKVDLPDMNREDIQLELHGDQLLIQGEKQFKKEDKDDKGYHLMERAYGSFRRVIPLPFTLSDSSEVKASYDKGVLTVLLPKPAGEQVNSKRIDIK